MRFTLFLLSFACTLTAQTEDAEKEYLHSLIVIAAGSDGVSLDEQKNLQRKGAAWNKLLKDFGGYPKLPYNENTNQIELSHILDLTGISKDIIYSRVKEWVAITYGSISTVLHYNDPERGKLIVKGYWPLLIRQTAFNYWGVPKGETVSSVKCNTTTIFTIKEGKLKMEFTNIEYGTTSYNQLDNRYGEQVRPITSLYPVTAAEEQTWKSRLSTLQQTDVALKLSANSLNEYIKNYQSDLDF